MPPFLALITPIGDTSGGGQPPGYWGGVAPPLPTHPIAPGGPPLGIWGGYRPPYVDIGGPGPQPHPEHPIYIPAPPTSPPGSPPIAVQLPVFPWTPSHPIQLPPEVAPPTPERPIDWKIVWTPTTGWVVVGVPSGAHPAPSSGMTPT
jgi:hypothetical protein